MEESREIRCMRNMAWHRAKGEISSMLETYYGYNGRFEKMKKAFSEFVEHVESEGLQE